MLFESTLYFVNKKNYAIIIAEEKQRGYTNSPVFTEQLSVNLQLTYNTPSKIKYHVPCVVQFTNSQTHKRTKKTV